MPKIPDYLKPIKLSDGTVRYRFVVDVNPPGAPRKQKTVTKDSVTEAKAAYAKLKAEVAQGLYVDADNRTLEQQCAEWLKGRARIRDTTEVCYEDALKPPRSRLGQVKLQKLTKPQIEELRDWMHTQGRRVGKKAGGPLKARTVNLMLTALTMVLEDAYKQGLVARNVAALVDKLPEADEREEMDAWTERECVTFLDAVGDDPLYVAFCLSLYGLRRGEVMGLRWSDIDLDEGTMSIRVTRKMVRGKPRHGVPKSNKGKRTLPLDGDLIAGFRKLKARQASEKLRAGSAYGPPCDDPRCDGERHVFVDELGAPLHPEYYSALFQRAAKRVGMRVIRLHDSRHTCGSVMALRGVPPVIIAAWLGHADARFTMATYVHSNNEALGEGGKVLALAYKRGGAGDA